MGVIQTPQPVTQGDVISKEAELGGFVTKSDVEKLGEVPQEATKGEFNTDLIPLRMFFGLDVEDLSQDSELQEIREYAKKKGIENTEQLKDYIRKVEGKMGVGLMQGKRTSQLVYYIRLISQFNESKEALSAFKGKL